MLGWLGKLFARRLAPLTGAPASPRRKSYPSAGGYVYEYHFLGHRPRGGADEYVFEVSPDRKTSFPVSVVLEPADDRALRPNERYAVAKMALFQAFDERAPAAVREPIRVRRADLEGLLERLGLE